MTTQKRVRGMRDIPKATGSSRRSAHPPTGANIGELVGRLQALQARVQEYRDEHVVDPRPEVSHGFRTGSAAGGSKSGSGGFTVHSQPGGGRSAARSSAKTTLHVSCSSCFTAEELETHAAELTGEKSAALVARAKSLHEACLGCACTHSKETT